MISRMQVSTVCSLHLAARKEGRKVRKKKRSLVELGGIRVKEGRRPAVRKARKFR